MKVRIKRLVYNILLSGIIVSCHNSSENKKTAPISPENIAIEINKTLPAEPTQAEHPGKAVYTQYCLTCHQADGSGVPGMHPPLGRVVGLAKIRKS